MEARSADLVGFIQSQIAIVNQSLREIAADIGSRQPRRAPGEANSGDPIAVLGDELETINGTLTDIKADIQTPLLMAGALRNLWWVGVGILFIIFFHVRLAVISNNGLWMQRAGSAVILIGVLVAAWPYWPDGLSKNVERQLRRPSWVSRTWRDVSAQRAKEKRAIAIAVAYERYAGVAIISIGTLLSGYGDLLLGFTSG